jgi:Protein of unknown function (DUF2839)
MGDSKRRKASLGENYGQEVKKSKGDQFVEITTTGAWVGIGVMVVGWAVFRFIGPSLGWWTLVG